MRKASQYLHIPPDLSLPEFLALYGSEAQCEQAVQQARWPSGYCCPRCGTQPHCVVGPASRRVFQCTACRQQTSLTSGTVFANTKLPLTTWFLAIYFFSQARTGVSAMALKRHLGVSYPTALLMHRKIVASIARCDAAERLAGAVRIDDPS